MVVIVLLVTSCLLFLLILLIYSYNIATTVPTSAVQYRPALVKLVMEKKVKTNLQISEAVAFLKKLPANATVFHSNWNLISSLIKLLLRLLVVLVLK